ncbi:Cytochrome P450 [Tolypocladium capitatum]|uniref:Cytochrome P450 n=1 Tax=Tolypocladium capitatum TaxID=45235 RepID=A0A2K3QHQ0_9HYPO|nr:Cytochrome P450 [Tolypocladium capitatum]
MALLTTAATVVAERWVLVSTFFAALFVSLIVPRLWSRLLLSRIPVVGADVGGIAKRREAYLSEAKRFYLEGYQKVFKHGVFRLTTASNLETLVLSTKFLPELRELPDTTLSMSAAVAETLESKYTGFRTEAPMLVAAVKAYLTPSLPKLLPSLWHEAQAAVDREMPEAKEWTEVNINSILLRIIATVSGRVFVGPELCRNEQYMDAAINYTLDIISARQAVKLLRPWLRPLLGPRLPEVKRLQRRVTEADAILRPVVDQRLAGEKDASYVKSEDLLQWLIDARDKFPSEESSNLGSLQMFLTFAAIHTTGMSSTNLMYDVAAFPELAAEIRLEAQEALAESEAGDSYTSRSLHSMKKLDSALKEDLRFYTTGGSFQRKVLQSFTLSDGQVIPAGVIIEVPAVAINNDPDVFPDADRHDPLRFYKLRQAARQGDSKDTMAAATNQFVSVNPTSLSFGYGRHACPGRFFVANEIKMIVVAMLARYDFKLAQGSERYPNIVFAGESMPDPSKTLLCRRREPGVDV